MSQDVLKMFKKIVCNFAKLILIIFDQCRQIMMAISTK